MTKLLKMFTIYSIGQLLETKGTQPKQSKQRSSNDILYSGPCLLPLVKDIFLRFGKSETAVVADIQQAFLQISIAETHRNLL